MSDSDGLTHDHSPCWDPRLVTIKLCPSATRGRAVSSLSQPGITFSSDLWAGARPDQGLSQHHHRQNSGQIFKWTNAHSLAPRHSAKLAYSVFREHIKVHSK